MAGFFAFVGFVAFIIFIVMAIVSKVRKTGKGKKMLLLAAGSFVLFMIGAVNSGSTETEKASTEVEAEETSKEVEKKDEKSAEELAKEKAKAEEEAKRKEEEAKKAEEEARKEKEAEEAKKKAEALKNSGNGDTATDMFDLEAGFVVFDSTYNGGGNFIVELLDENGNNVELLINHIGTYKGKTIAMIPAAGEYMLNVQAEGAWTVNGSQEIPQESESDSISGSGDDVRFVEIDSGMKRFHFDYKGDSNFIVMANGSVLLANEIGTYNGSTAQRVQDDAVYLISIKSEGDWKIDIE